MRVLFTVVVSALHFSLIAQSFISIEGTVNDSNDETPLAYSHIIIKDSGIGTVANEDGQFVFKVPLTRQNDSIKVSAIGYETRSFLISGIADNTNVQVKLDQQSKVLDEVLITPIDPTLLVQELVANIPKNYGVSPTRLTGFYRETVKINNEFYSYLEGVIGAYKTGYNEEGSKSDQVKVIKGRRREGKIIQDSTRRPPTINSGPITINSYDLIKRRRNFVNAKKSKFYSYELTDITTYGGRDIYVVDFKARKDSKKALAYGKMYIDMESKALLRADYQLNALGIEIVNKKNINNGKNSNFIVTAKSLLAVVDYDLSKGYWGINQLRVKMGFDYYIKSLATTDYMELNIHLITTKKERGNVTGFSKDEAFRSRRAFANNLGEDDPDFWENYNILKQDERLKEAFSK
ncbi:MAG: carboxypeptidase-like regulatory domain-containing protein [Bacteroidota bacterium]